jgi:hypothetical protein
MKGDFTIFADRAPLKDKIKFGKELPEEIKLIIKQKLAEVRPKETNFIINCELNENISLRESLLELQNLSPLVSILC